MLTILAAETPNGKHLAGDLNEVYWGTAALDPQDENNPTAPFSTKDYDATTLLRCRAADAAEFGTCPAGALRMEGLQDSIEFGGDTPDENLLKRLASVDEESGRSLYFHISNANMLAQFLAKSCSTGSSSAAPPADRSGSI